MPYIPKQYDSAKNFLTNYNNMGNIIDPFDSQRVSSYNLYDDFYANRPDTFKVTLRGDSDVEIYLPSTKKIVDSTARFLAVDFDFVIKNGNQSAVEILTRNMFSREEVQKKFIRGKKSGLTRADTIWHITADTRKRAGERISINTVHPSSYFTIEDPENAFRVIGVHLVDLVHDPRDTGNDRTKQVARRQTYLKEPNGGISSEARLFEIGGWDDRYLKPNELKPVAILSPKKMLPESITAIPVYHIANNEPDGSSWGTSQVAGIEYIINALNQSMTYEDLTLVLQGLGVYVSTAGPPMENGKPGKYKLHPGNVVEISQGDTFQRVTGVASVAPFQEHLGLLDNWALQGSGLPEMATGVVDVTVAQSGIALALKMGPIIAENSDKQLTIGGKWDQMGYDLIHGWYPAFEELDSPDSVWTSTFGDPMPINRDEYVQERINLYTAGLLLIDEVRQDLEKIGYPYSKDLTEKLLEEQTSKSTAATGDQFGSSLQGTGVDLNALLNPNGNSPDITAKSPV
jgi:hypothetical protein